MKNMSAHSLFRLRNPLLMAALLLYSAIALAYQHVYLPLAA